MAMNTLMTSMACSILGLPTGIVSILYEMFRSKDKVILQDKVVLLTGASGGLGEAVAEVFYDAGCKLILSGRQIKSLEKVRDKLTSRMKANCHIPAIVVMDLNDSESIPGKVNEAIAAFGHIDILINNAGMTCRGWAHETKLDVDEMLINTNYFGPVRVTKALLPHMMERKRGQIVAVSSIQGKVGIPDRAAYSASKHALEGFFGSLRAELSYFNIDVSLISSYYIRTNFSINAVCGDGSQYNRMDASTQSGLEPEYVAKQLLRCVVRRKQELIIAPFYVRLAIILRYLAPALFFRIMVWWARKRAPLKCKGQ